MTDFSAGSVSTKGWIGHDPDVLALILTLPATLVGLVAILALTSGLERSLSRSMQPAQVRTDRGVRPAPVSARH